ncbi:MAG: hypothetical protein HFG70_09330 [Hungatella sp.]|nr:hypothetical protein [Hungatella sp.]
MREQKRKQGYQRAVSLAPWGILTVLLLFYYLKVDINYGDDVEFLKALDHQSLWQWTAERYHTWSSRNLIEAVMIVFQIWAPGLWRVLNVAMYVLMGHLIAQLFTDGGDQVKWVIAGGIMMLFGWDLHDAGYIASSLNYLWPGVCALLAMVPVKKHMEGIEPAGKDYLLLLPAVFAANEELTAVFIAGSGAVVIAFTIWKRKKVSPYLWYMWLLGAAGLVYIMTCPGNQVRTAREIVTWYPEFVNLTFCEKLENGFLSASYSLIRKGNYLYVFLTMLMAILAASDFVTGEGGMGGFVRALWKHIRYKKLQTWVFGVILSVTVTALGCLRPMTARLIPALSSEDYVESLLADGPFGGEAAVFAGLWVILFVVLYQAAGDRQRFFRAGYMMLFGLSSKTVMGFSPTVYASGNRTCFFMLMSTIAVTAIMMDRAAERLPDRITKWGSRLYGLAGIYVIGCQVAAVWRM